MTSAHDVIDKVECETCHRRFPPSYIEKHKLVHEEPGERVPCPLCSKTYKNKQSLEAHMKLHNGTHARLNPDNKRLACPECGKMFAFQNELTRHLRCHTGEKPYACEVCHKAYPQKGSLDIHMRTHTGHRPFRCSHDGCGKAFYHSSHRAAHELTHSAEKTVPCQLCSKMFRSQAHLNIHMKFHAGVRNYACHECGKTFITTSHLRRHVMTVHQKEGPKKHTCHTCNISFHRKDHLKSHEKNCGRTQNFICEGCGYFFTTPTFLKKHLQVCPEAAAKGLSLQAVPIVNPDLTKRTILVRYPAPTAPQPLTDAMAVSMDPNQVEQVVEFQTAEQDGALEPTIIYEYPKEEYQQGDITMGEELVIDSGEFDQDMPVVVQAADGEEAGPQSIMVQYVTENGEEYVRVVQVDDLNSILPPEEVGGGDAPIEFTTAAADGAAVYTTEDGATFTVEDGNFITQVEGATLLTEDGTVTLEDGTVAYATEAEALEVTQALEVAEAMEVPGVILN